MIPAGRMGEDPSMVEVRSEKYHTLNNCYHSITRTFCIIILSILSYDSTSTGHMHNARANGRGAAEVSGLCTLTITLGTFRFQSTSSATKSLGSDVFTFTVRPLLSFALFRIQFRFHSTSTFYDVTNDFSSRRPGSSQFSERTGKSRNVRDRLGQRTRGARRR